MPYIAIRYSANCSSKIKGCLLTIDPILGTYFGHVMIATLQIVEWEEV